MRLTGLFGAPGQGGFQAAGTSPASSAGGNPALTACLSERLGTIDKMNNDGVITAAQYDLFRTRAISYCETEFPPAR